MIELTHAKNDTDWSEKVLATNNGYCIICGSTATPAHIWRRGWLALRLVVQNGLPLCVRCHNWYDSLNPKGKKKATVLLIGEILYNRLKEYFENNK